MLTRAAGSAPATVYLLEDQLGGVDGFTSESGALLSRVGTSRSVHVGRATGSKRH